VLPLQETTAGASADAEILELCRQGDRAGYERLLRVHGGRMKSIAWNMLRNQEDAEDAVQETFLRVHRSLHTYSGQALFSTWIFRILVNVCRDAQRARRPSEELPAGLTGPPSPAPLRVALQRALDVLNQRQRTVFMLAEVEGFKHSEIAAILGIAVGTSKGLLWEARKILQELLAPPRGGQERMS
jgi:RNA polymerase sigma-70 factor (ECF subfamily)